MPNRNLTKTVRGGGIMIVKCIVTVTDTESQNRCDPCTACALPYSRSGGIRS